MWHDAETVSNSLSAANGVSYFGSGQRLQSIVMSMSVCVSVCLRGYLRNHTRDLYHIFVHVAYVRRSVLLRHVDDRPHRREGDDGGAQRGEA